MESIRNEMVAYDGRARGFERELNRFSIGSRHRLDIGDEKVIKDVIEKIANQGGAEYILHRAGYFDVTINVPDIKCAYSYREAINMPRQKLNI